MKKTLILSLLGLLVCGALSAPAQAYYPNNYYRPNHFAGYQGYRPGWNNWGANRFQEREIRHQEFEHHEWRVEHPFLSLF